MLGSPFAFIFFSNTQWYVRHPRESSAWTEKQMRVNTSEVDNQAANTELYIRVLFDVTTESGTGRLELDNITLSHTSACDDGGGRVAGETSTDKPDTALSISAKTDQ